MWMGETEVGAVTRVGSSVKATGIKQLPIILKAKKKKRKPETLLFLGNLSYSSENVTR